jgi:hypothetical protein
MVERSVGNGNGGSGRREGFDDVDRDDDGGTTIRDQGTAGATFFDRWRSAAPHTVERGDTSFGNIITLKHICTKPSPLRDSRSRATATTSSGRIDQQEPSNWIESDRIERCAALFLGWDDSKVRSGWSGKMVGTCAG